MTATGPTAGCWVVTEGAAGMENQALGLAEALGLEPLVIRPPRPPLHGIVPPHWLPAGLLVPRAHALARSGGTAPRLVISCGHKAVAWAVALRRAGKGQTCAVHIQNPLVPPGLFDLVLAPAHDRLTGANVVPTRGALHRITPGRLAAAKAQFADQFASLPRPLIVALIGGASRRYRFDADAARQIGTDLARVAAESGGSILATTSRRTSADATRALRAAIGDTPGMVWTGDGENPYFGYLAHADHLFVTCDSVTMTSEAVATGVPVHVVRLEGRGSRRFKRFFDAFADAGYTRWFDGALDAWPYEPPRETERAASIVRDLLGDRLGDL